MIQTGWHNGNIAFEENSKYTIMIIIISTNVSKFDMYSYCTFYTVSLENNFRLKFLLQFIIAHAYQVLKKSDVGDQYCSTNFSNESSKLFIHGTFGAGEVLPV